MALTDRASISYDCGPKGLAGQGGKASTRGSSAKLTAGNIAAQDTAGAAWAGAASPLTNAVVTRWAIDHGQDFIGSPPTAPLNKGEKWVITMQENGGNQRFFTHTIPAPVESGGHLITGTLNADLTNADWVAYATAANAFLTTPDGGAMTLTKATILTRRR